MAKRLKRPIRKNYYSPKRRAIYAKGEKIDHLAIFERDGWVCQLCHKVIDKTVRYPSWWCGTLDHIIPLAQGGTHTTSNVQAAHRRCNEVKADRLDFQRAV